MVRRLLTLVGVLVLTEGMATGIALASNWTGTIASGSSGEARSQTVSAPTGVTASCPAPTTSKTIKVVWTAVTHATNYSIYDSTTSSSSGYSLIASGVSGTSWTSGTLATASYWFEVRTNIGSNWQSTSSSATSQASTHSSSLYCTQP